MEVLLSDQQAKTFKTNKHNIVVLDKKLQKDLHPIPLQQLILLFR